MCRDRAFVCAGVDQPPDLVVQLSQPPRGFEYVIIAGKLLLVEAATQVVREILLETVFG